MRSRLYLLFLSQILPFCISVIQIPHLSRFARLSSSYPIRVFEAQGTIIRDASRNQHLALFGGFSKFPAVTLQSHALSLDKTPLKWRSVANLPYPLTHIAQAVHGSTLCGAGGFAGAHPGPSSSRVYCFSLIKNAWRRLPDLPAPRAGGGMVFIRFSSGLYLVFAGGVERNSRGKHTDHSETWRIRVSPGIGRWETFCGRMPDPRNHMAAVKACGRYFWVGGQHKEDEFYGARKSVSELVIRGGGRFVEWRRLADLPYPVGHISASVMGYRCGIIVVGGTSNGIKKMNTVLYWESRRNKWYVIGKYPYSVATPVCGIHRSSVLVCATGLGGPRNEVFSAKIRSRTVR